MGLSNCWSEGQDTSELQQLREEEVSGLTGGSNSESTSSDVPSQIPSRTGFGISLS